MFGRRRRDIPPQTPPADGRLRFVLFRTAGANFTIDALVDDEGTGRLGATGSMVTLRLRRPAAPQDDLTIEHVLRQWAEDDLVVDVTMGDDRTVTALQAEGAAMRLQLVS